MSSMCCKVTQSRVCAWPIAWKVRRYEPPIAIEITPITPITISEMVTAQLTALGDAFSNMGYSVTFEFPAYDGELFAMLSQASVGLGHEVAHLCGHLMYALGGLLLSLFRTHHVLSEADSSTYASDHGTNQEDGDGDQDQPDGINIHGALGSPGDGARAFR